MHISVKKCDIFTSAIISVLPVISKIIEKHITKRLFAFLNKYDILHKSQYWFKKKPFMQYSIIKFVRQMVEKIVI